MPSHVINDMDNNDMYYSKNTSSLVWWAYLPELLSVALTLQWAYTAQSGGAILPWIFCSGFVGFVAFRVISVPGAVDAIQAKQWPVAIAFSTLAAGSLVLLFGTSVFSLLDSSDESVHERIEASRPALALDAEIQAARKRLASLAPFADAGKAHQAELDNQAATLAAKEAEAQAMAALAELSAPTMPEHLARWMHSDCSPKHDTNGRPYRTRAEQACPEWQAMQADYAHERDALQAQIQAARASSPNSGGYAARHAEYLGVQAHLVALENRRAELSESGLGVQSAYRAEDRFVASVLGVEPETASWLKWIIFAASFDLLALLARIGAALSVGSNERRVDGQDVQVAKVNLNAIPEMRAGGTVLSDGLVFVHAGEEILPLDKASNYRMWQPSNSRPSNKRPSNKSPLGKSPLGKAHNKDTSNKDTSNKRPSNESPLDKAPLDKAPLGRRKGDASQCVDCGAPIVLRHKNHKRCANCRDKNERDYRIKHRRR